MRPSCLRGLLVGFSRRFGSASGSSTIGSRRRPSESASRRTRSAERVVDARRVALHADLELVAEIEHHLVLDAQLSGELVDPDLLRGQSRSRPSSPLVGDLRRSLVSHGAAIRSSRARRRRPQRPLERPPPRRLVEAGHADRARTARLPARDPRPTSRPVGRPVAAERARSPARLRRHPTQVRRGALRAHRPPLRQPTSPPARCRPPARPSAGAVLRRGASAHRRPARSRLGRFGVRGAASSAVRRPASALGAAAGGGAVRAPRSRPRPRRSPRHPRRAARRARPGRSSTHSPSAYSTPPPDSSSASCVSLLMSTRQPREPRREPRVLAFLADRERQLEVGDDHLGGAGVGVDAHLAHACRRERLHHELGGSSL